MLWQYYITFGFNYYFLLFNFKFPKRKKIVKKKKIYFRSDFTGDCESSSDDDTDNQNNEKQGVCALNPVSMLLNLTLLRC